MAEMRRRVRAAGTEDALIGDVCLRKTTKIRQGGRAAVQGLQRRRIQRNGGVQPVQARVGGACGDRDEAKDRARNMADRLRPIDPSDRRQGLRRPPRVQISDGLGDARVDGRFGRGPGGRCIQQAEG